MHRVARRWPSWPRGTGATIRYGAEVAEIVVAAAGRRGVRLAGGERDRRPTPWWSTPTRRRSPPACSARRRRGAPCRAAAARSARCPPLTWAMLAETERLPAAAPQRLLLRRLPGRVRRARAPARCRPSPPSMSAPRTAATTATRRAPGPERLLLPGQRARRPATRAPSRQRRSSNARTGAFGLLERCGLQIRPIGGAGADHAGRVPPPVPGDGGRAVRPGGARADGDASAAGQPDRRCRACIWRGAARIRGRGCRWRRCPAGWRRRRVMADLGSTRRSRRAAMSGGMSTR